MNTQSQRKACKDVFHAFLVKNANYHGVLELPCIKPTQAVPNKLIAFSKCLSSKDYNQWVHFYEDDYLFERLWHNPKRYLQRLKSYQGVILPDFSLYSDMPLVMQLWNIYRSRALGHWLSQNGITVIPNIRFSDKRTFLPSTLGIAKHATIAIGTHGALKCLSTRKLFIQGLEFVVNELKPSAIIVYGKTPKPIFEKYSLLGINIIHFESEFALSRKKGGV